MGLVARAFAVILVIASSGHHVFGSAAAAELQTDAYSLVVPLFVNGRYQREIQVLVPRRKSPLRIEARPFTAVMARGLDDELLAELSFRADAQGFLTADDLIDLGLAVEFDSAELRLVVKVPILLLRTQIIELHRQPAEPDPELSGRPADFSAFANVRAASEYVHESDSTVTEPGRQPLFMNLDGAFRPGPMVVEWAGTYDQDRERLWQRGDVSAVFDQPDRAWRTRAGDLSYATTGFQSFVAAGGLTFAKDFDLQPYRVTRPTVRGSFFLEQESKVEVLVNDVVVRTLRLSPGPYDIRDFPLRSGINDAKLRITDSTGRVQVLNYPAVIDNDLLAPGEDEFSYSLGMPSSTVDGIRHYDTSLTNLSLFHRSGITDTLTLGGSFQGSHLQQMAGLEGVWATGAGVFDLDLGLSRVDGYDDGLAARLGFRREDNTLPRDWSRVWSFSAEFKGPDFAPLGVLDPDNDTAWDFTARVSQRLPFDVSVGVAGSYQLGRSGRRDTDSQGLFVSKLWDNGITTNINLDRERGTDGDIENSVFLSFSIPLFEGRQKVTVTRDSGSRTSRAYWERRSRRPVGGIDTELAVERDADTTDVSGDLVYRGTRGRVTMAHEITRPRGDGNDTLRDRRTTWRLESALVFADGHFGIGRPVTNSFAVLTPNPALEGHEIGVNPFGSDGHVARIDALGNAVLPELGAYRQSSAEIDAPELPLGLELGPHRYQLLPAYKSGILIEIGTGATVFVVGRLIDEAGEPVTLTAAEIVDLDRPDKEGILTFTNRSGRFAAEGLRPGRYALRLLADPDRPIAFEVPEGTSGRYDLGRLMRAQGSGG